jgi:hypothetical protein
MFHSRRKDENSGVDRAPILKKSTECINKKKGKVEREGDGRYGGSS